MVYLGLLNVYHYPKSENLILAKNGWLYPCREGDSYDFRSDDHFNSLKGKPILFHCKTVGKFIPVKSIEFYEYNNYSLCGGSSLQILRQV